MAIINEKKPTDLKTVDFYYDLPERLIAQHPMEKRDTSRLMVIDRESGKVEHKHFYDIIDYLQEGDVLVINDSKVIPARLYGHAEGREEALLELLLLRQHELDCWECLVKPGKRARIGSRAVFGDGILRGEVLDIVEEGNRIIKFDYDREKYSSIYEVLQEVGMMPLPPYITEKLENLVIKSNSISDSKALAFFIKDEILPCMELLRASADKAETLTADCDMG